MRGATKRCQSRLLPEEPYFHDESVALVTVVLKRCIHANRYTTEAHMGIIGLAGALLCRFGSGSSGVDSGSGVLCGLGTTRVGAFGIDIWSSMDDFIRSDGNCGLVGMEGRRFKCASSGVVVFSRPADFQWRVELAVFCRAVGLVSLRGHSGVVGTDSRDNGLFFTGSAPCRDTAIAVSPVGQFCGVPQLCRLAPESDRTGHGRVRGLDALLVKRFMGSPTG
jgi:hypothetical protein